MIKDAFPGKPVIPSIGNNDVPIHNSVPCTEGVAKVYYRELFDTWFTKDEFITGADYSAAKESFNKGGYYKFNFADSNVAVISLNSMFFSMKNKC